MRPRSPTRRRGTPFTNRFEDRQHRPRYRFDGRGKTRFGHSSNPSCSSQKARNAPVVQGLERWFLKSNRSTLLPLCKLRNPLTLADLPRAFNKSDHQLCTPIQDGSSQKGVLDRCWVLVTVDAKLRGTTLATFHHQCLANFLCAESCHYVGCSWTN